MAVAAQPSEAQSALAAPLSRRSLVLATATLSLLPLPAWADGNVVQFYGAANPPATYGGVGGTTRQFARYGFLIPDTFTEEAVSKVDKGSGGVDCRFATGGRKRETVFVVSLRNEGAADGRGFALAADPNVALQTVAGSSTVLQDAIGAGTVTATRKGDKYVYDLQGPTCGAFVVTTKGGRLFALSVLAPASSWAADKDQLVAIRDSFEAYDVPE